MPLPLRERQRDAVVRMLNLNAPPSRAQGLDAGAGEVYKVLVMDRFCFEIVTPLIKVNELRILLANDLFRMATEEQEATERAATQAATEVH